jgi:hypothetical protein
MVEYNIFRAVLPALLGIYTLWVMFNSETQQLFERQPQFSE